MAFRREHVEVEMVPLAALKPYDGNAKKHTNEQIDAVEASIREFGFRNPVLAWHDGDTPGLWPVTPAASRQRISEWTWSR